MDELIVNSNESFLAIAKAQAVYNLEVLDGEERIKPEEIIEVWFCKTIQNYKTILFALRAVGAKFVEVTYNGDKKEMYFDYYQKVLKDTLHLD